MPPIMPPDEKTSSSISAIKNLQVFVDRGGTFTDIIAVDDDDHVYVHKVLSERRRGDQTGTSADSDTTSSGIKELLQLIESRHGVKAEANEIRIGTTVATNALLTRSGARLALVTNKGFADALEIGYQARNDIFALDIKRAQLLYSEVIEIDCRLDAEGNILRPLNEKEVREKLAELKRRAPETALAIVLMHSYKFSEDELQVGKIASALGFKTVSLSHQVSPLIKYIGRGDTTCVDAYLSPPLSAYTDRLAQNLDGKSLSFMKSDGGLAVRAEFTGKDALLSGPAGGVVGAVKFGANHNFKTVTAFDMGGTSTDVSYFEGKFEKQYETTISDVRVRVPMVAVHTVAAGGGSILGFDGARLTVGPESAGASPGPSCYGNGGPLTITDANLICGRVAADFFPRTFGKSGQEPLNAQAAETAFESLAQSVFEKTNLQSYKDKQYLAYGYIKVAVEKMCRAISRVSTEKGHDVSTSALVAFGGAGGQHACLIAERLNIKSIIVSPLAGVLSAYGIGATAHSAHSRRYCRQMLQELSADALRLTLDSERQKTMARLDATSAATTIETLYLGQLGTDYTIGVALKNGKFDKAEIEREFLQEHQRLYGFVPSKPHLIVEDIGVEVSLPAPARHMQDLEFLGYQDKEHIEYQQMFAKNGLCQARLLTRRDLKAGLVVAGPAIIADATGTTIVEPDWQAQVLEDTSILMTPANTLHQKSETNKQHDEPCDPVQLELYNNIFMSIAEEMGVTLQQVSHSVNIKERLDFSCAVFDSAGRLIANAPHMPVHLGSMGEAVVSLMRDRGGDFKNGDVYISNDPYNGGTHLPDITAISPVYINSADKPSFFVASRGHHADIGGISPGSMPPLSRTIQEEGTLLDNVLIVRDSELLTGKVKEIFLSGPYPARNIEKTMADLKAQIAANNKGQQALIKLAKERGLAHVLSYMDHIRDNAAKAIRDILKELKDGQATCTMDDGSTIEVKISIDRQAEIATVDFTGTSKETDNNFNAPQAVVRAAVLYVFRTLTKQDIPLNDGCAEPLRIIIPPHTMLSPSPPHAVVAGNVETSQIIVDALYQALNKLANCQGTMNNFTFGNDQYQYYETVCGGAGAGINAEGEGFAGASAVQTHMTNSRLTDPEILETRFPVLLEEFSIRRGSGGKGKFVGGNGTKRTLKFLAPMQASILSNRRKTKPQGILGGQEGQPGRTVLIKSNGEVITLDSTDTRALEAGDSITIETPGAGGCQPI